MNNRQLAIQQQEQKLQVLGQQRAQLQTFKQELEQTQQPEPTIELDWQDEPFEINTPSTNVDFNAENTLLKQQLAQQENQLDRQMQQQQMQLHQMKMQYTQWLTQCGTDEKRTIHQEGNTVTVESQTLQQKESIDPMSIFIGISAFMAIVAVIIATLVDAFKASPLMFVIALLIVVGTGIYIWIGRTGAVKQ